ncbi:hypothetical protein EUZ85_27805 [Hahella sp. KA22]|uniref:hypothetical protein n=1 Tax=Hahella sp. KA22 TaxID=1628392 RepID=UPI000FDE9C35|nr:hypothetical protein [Hahella sp. KA22]AZZ94321.1 hypothetical protein ENC22_25220 [Hahella sp. KA22]QAY57695.1 hypothetical protein EUZ85_27805 [Hahella sp. KA22]
MNNNKYNLGPVHWSRSALIVVAVAVTLQGCEKLETKPKDPTVPSPDFVLSGLQYASEISLQRDQARVMRSIISGNSRAGLGDLLDKGGNGGYAKINTPKYKFDDAGFMNASGSRYGGISAAGDLFFLTDVAAISTTFYAGVKVDETATAENPDGDIVYQKPDLTQGDYLCIEETYFPSGADNKLTVQIHKATLDTDGNGVLQRIGSTGAGAGSESRSIAYSFDDEAVLSWSDPPLDEAFDEVVQNAGYTLDCPVDNDGNPVYDPCRWSVRTLGGASPDGRVFHFSRVAWKEQVPVTPPEDDSPGNAEVGGWRPVASSAICLRTATDMANNALLGEYWLGVVIEDQDIPQATFSRLTLDGAGAGVDSQIRASAGIATRNLSVSYNVEPNGELTYSGRMGIASADGELLVFDASDPANGKIGFGVAMKNQKPAGQEE